MRRRPPLCALLATLALLLSACVAPASLPAASSADPFAALLARSQDLGPASAGRSVDLLLLLRDGSAGRQAADLAAMYRPGSPAFGRYETPAQFAAGYPVDPAVVARVRAYLGARGLTAHWAAGSTWLAVSGPPPAIDATFGASVHRYVSPDGLAFLASAADPRVPAALAPWVAAAGRIDTATPRVLKRPGRLSAVPPGGLTPDGLVAAYDLKPLRDQGLDGTGETIVFMEFDAFDQKDLDAFTQHFHLPPIRPEVHGKALQPAEGEATMDLEVAHAIAPAAKLVVYNHPNLSDAQIPDYHRQVLEANRGAVFSLSIGYGCDLAAGRTLEEGLQRAYAESAQLGDTVFVASGDSGAFTCLDNAKQWGIPPSDKYVSADAIASLPGVTGTGGTSLSVNADGSWYDETVWEDPARTVGSGGDISAFFPAPSWQQGPGVANQFNTQQHRQVPDIAADADNASGVSIVESGQLTPGGGTSQAAPIWAGSTALINQYLKGRGLHGVGFFNPALYALAAGKPANPPFHDITVGGNMVYPATPGYDLATGLGSPDVWNLARDLADYQQGGGQ